MQTLRPSIRVAGGNMLENYDFQIFGYYAAAIAATFFPSGDEFASLMLSLATFGTGFMMRPLGALILGPYVDHRPPRGVAVDLRPDGDRDCLDRVHAFVCIDRPDRSADGGCRQIGAGTLRRRRV